MANERRKTVGGVQVSWHALVRFMERFGGKEELALLRRAFQNNDYKLLRRLGADDQTLDRVAQKIVTDELWAKMFENDFQDGDYSCDMFTVVLKNGIIMTVLRPDELHKRKPISERVRKRPR